MCRGLLLLLLALPARADVGSDGYELDEVFFVPELGQAWTLGVALEGRFAGLAGQEDSPWPTRGLRLDLGWLYYFTGHGELSVGPYFGYGRSFGDPLNPDTSFQHLAFGGIARLRLTSARFFTLSFAVFGEGGPFFARADEDAPPETQAGTGGRYAIGTELFGIGGLWFLSPWLFGEIVPWLALEVITVDEKTVHLGGGLRLRVDWGRR